MLQVLRTYGWRAVGTTVAFVTWNPRLHNRPGLFFLRRGLCDVESPPPSAQG